MNGILPSLATLESLGIYTQYFTRFAFASHEGTDPDKAKRRLGPETIYRRIQSLEGTALTSQK